MSAPRAVILSAGAWSTSTHLPALVDAGAEVIAMTSLSVERLKPAAELFSVPATFTDFRAALSLEPDLVIVAGPPVSHLEQAVAALARGIPTLVEKPMALDSSEAKAIVDVAKEGGAPLLVGFTWSSADLFQEVRRILSSGELGAIEFFAASIHANTRDLLNGSSTAGWDKKSVSDPATYVDPKVSGGGVGMVTMCHLLSVVTWLLDDAVDTVAAQSFSTSTGIDLHISTLAKWRSGASGPLVATSTQTLGDPTRWHIDVRGSEGDLFVDTLTGEISVRLRDGSERSVYDQAAGVPNVRMPVHALVDVANGASVPRPLSGETGLEVCSITDAIYRSAARDGAPERVHRW